MATELRMLDYDNDKIYLNDGNHEFMKQVFPYLSGNAQKCIFLFQRIRQAIYNAEEEFNTFTLLELQDMLEKDKMNTEGARRCIDGLSRYFDEFSPLTCAQIETLERKFINKDIFLSCLEAKKNPNGF